MSLKPAFQLKFFLIIVLLASVNAFGQSDHFRQDSIQKLIMSANKVSKVTVVFTSKASDYKAITGFDSLGRQVYYVFKHRLKDLYDGIEAAETIDSTFWIFDAKGFPGTKKVFHAGEAPMIIQFKNDALGNEIEKVIYKGGIATETVKRKYDSKNRLIRSAFYEGKELTETDSIVYDSEKHMEYIWVRKGKGKTYKLSRWFTFDTQGRLILTEGNIPGMGVSFKEYDTLGNIVHEQSSNGLEERYEYDKNGNCIKAESLKNGEVWFTKTYTYNDHNQVWTEHNDERVIHYYYLPSGLLSEMFEVVLDKEKKNQKDYGEIEVSRYFYEYRK